MAGRDHLTVMARATLESIQAEQDRQVRLRAERILVSMGRRTQRQVADELGVTQHAVCRWISGQRVPHLDAIPRLAQVLDVDPAWLAWGDPR